MKDRGKGIAISSNNWFPDYSYSSELPCKKHPSSSSSSTGGICAYCLRDRLIKLVCSDCGEQRLSSCSCSDISSSSYSVAEVGSVGRISFLIENEKENSPFSNSNINRTRSESTVKLKRSSSSSCDVKRSSTGFWKFGRFFRKKIEKGSFDLEFSSEMGSGNGNGGGGLDDLEGGFNGVESILGCDPIDEKISNFIGLELKEEDHSVTSKSGLMDLEDSGFIDIKFGFSSESARKSEFSSLNNDDDFFETKSSFRVSRGSDLSSEYESDSFNCLKGEKIFRSKSSCKIIVNEKENKKKCQKSLKVWKWIFKNYPVGGRTICKKHEDYGIRS